MAVQKRGKDSWFIKIYLGRGTNGKKQFYTETFHAPIKSMALARERELKAQLAKIGPSQQIRTLNEWFDRWLDLTAGTVTDSTYRCYKSHIKTLRPLVGELQLWDLSADKLIQAIGKNLDPLEPRSRKNLYATLQTAVRRAIEAKLVPYDALAGFKNPRVPKKQKLVLTKEQIYQALSVTDKYKHGLVIRLILLTGARLEEVLGLTWNRIDWKQNAIIIDQTVDTMKRVLKYETKTANSRRTIRLDEETMYLLKQHKHNQTVRALDSTDLVFRAEDGRPLKYTAVSKTWARIKKAANLPAEITIHGIRHSIVTLLLLQGTPPIMVASLVGHDVSTTVTRYAHQIREGKSLLLQE